MNLMNFGYCVLLKLPKGLFGDWRMLEARNRELQNVEFDKVEQWVLLIGKLLASYICA